VEYGFVIKGTASGTQLSTG